jgi:hypothetical protein
VRSSLLSPSSAEALSWELRPLPLEDSILHSPYRLKKGARPNQREGPNEAMDLVLLVF